MDRNTEHWEPQDLRNKIDKHKKLGENCVITSVEMRGVSGSKIVIDELIDFMGRNTKKGKLQKLVLDIAPHKDLDGLTPVVFKTLAAKCTKLKRFELFGTARLEKAQPREVLHEFFCSVLDACDKAGTLEDIRLSEVASEKEEAAGLLEHLNNFDQTYITSFNLVDMPIWLQDSDLAEMTLACLFKQPRL